MNNKEQSKEPLNFDRLREINSARSRNDIKVSNEWTPLEWGGAASGELGELCNLLKKMRRGQTVDMKDIAHEMADVVMYIDLLGANLGVDLGEAIREKFNIVSERWKSDYKL